MSRRGEVWTGAVIRKALGQMRAKLTDDEQRMTDFVREYYEGEIKNDLARRG